MILNTCKPRLHTGVEGVQIPQAQSSSKLRRNGGEKKTQKNPPKRRHLGRTREVFCEFLKRNWHTTHQTKNSATVRHYLAFLGITGVEFDQVAKITYTLSYWLCLSPGNIQLTKKLDQKKSRFVQNNLNFAGQEVHKSLCNSQIWTPTHQTSTPSLRTVWKRKRDGWRGWIDGLIGRHSFVWFLEAKRCWVWLSWADWNT